MEARSLSKRLDALSSQHGGKIPFGSMKGKGASKDKNDSDSTQSHSVSGTSLADSIVEEE